MTSRKRLLTEIALNVAAVAVLLALVHSRDRITVGQMQTRAAAIADAKKTAEISNRDALPSARIDINRAADGGWNIFVVTEKFGYATDPQHQTYVAKGFVHLLIDGRSAAKLDSPFHYVPFLPNGDHLVTILFEDRNGKAFSHGGEPVTQSLKLRVSGNDHTVTLP